MRTVLFWWLTQEFIITLSSGRNLVSVLFSSSPVMRRVEDPNAPFLWPRPSFFDVLGNLGAVNSNIGASVY